MEPVLHEQLNQPSQAAADSPGEAEDRHLAAGRRVLTLETEALVALSRALDQRFVRVIDLLAGITGRVIVTGMGKSGHVANKIAATLSSTGAPAFFVHPGEASHGDLGMITVSDAVLALSNSGRTNELADMIAYTRRFSIPLIGMTARANSPLAEQSDLALILPAAPEACPLGLAPTTSTTMMMALGDALAIALLERKGFSERDFQVLHPGGSLGQKLLRVADIMHGPEELPLCPPETPMAEAILIMTNRRFGTLGIIDEKGELIGIVTDGDLRRHMDADLLRHRAGEIMTAAPQSIRSQALAAEALGLMNAKAITSLFVVDGGQPIGILHVHDCLRSGIA
jgi:arabinose-5-phosphate isomerase